MGESAHRDGQLAQHVLGRVDIHLHHLRAQTRFVKPR